MVDIAEKLFPNLLTLFTQLAATGIIYFLYRKYVHQFVLNFLDQQAAELDKAQNYASVVEEGAAENAKRLEAEHQEKVEQLRKSQLAMRKMAEKEKEAIIQQAEAEKDAMLAEARNDLAKERQQMIQEVEAHVLDLAISITERTLENYSYNEEEVFQVLETELEQMQHETN